MLAVCLWAAPVAQALPSYSSASTADSYGAGSGKAPAVQAAPSYSSTSAAEPYMISPAVSQAGEDIGATLLLDVERTAVVQQGRVPRLFYYPGQKDERITIQVTAVSFAPEVFLKGPGGENVTLDIKPDGERSLKSSAVLGATGRYTIGVRSLNASNGLFHITLSPTPAVDAKGVDKSSK
jgi:hypothetical protein